eukprot:scpid15250/ scgid6351/ Protein notum homolog
MEGRLWCAAALALICFPSCCRSTLVREFIPDAENLNALCMDGSDAGYYLYRNQSSTKWIIHLQGGGFCTNPAECTIRASTDRGSSNTWPCALPHVLAEGDDDAATTVSSDSRKNPHFRYWNRVHVPYCSGDLWLGQRTNASSTVFNVLFNGHNIIVALIDDLLSRQGMNKATDVVFGGSSAGAIGVMLHLEDVAASVRSATRLAAGQAAFVGGYADGWTRLYPNLAETVAMSSVTPETSTFIAALVQLAHGVFAGYLPPTCTSMFPRTAPLYGFQCVDIRWGAATITSVPLVVLAARWDTYNIFLGLGDSAYSCLSTDLALDSTQASYVTGMGEYSYTYAVNVSQQAPSASGTSISMFFTNCYTHTFFGVEDLCSGVNDVTAYDTLVSFTTEAKAGRKVTTISPPPPSTKPLGCNTDCGAKQCQWGETTPLSTSANCTVPSRGFNEFRFGELCDDLKHRRYAVADTFNKQAVRYQVVNATARKAVCMDDTPFTYYVARNLSSDKWIIFLRGGGYCTTEPDCISRSKGHLGSSTHYACTLPAMEQGRTSVETLPQPINADPSINPFFHTWNRVYLRYCTGDVFIGQRTRAENNRFNVSTSGHFGFVGTVEDLLAYHGLDKARTVVLGGSSAGSLGAMAHLDFVNNMINNHTSGMTKVVGGLDGGWFRSFPVEQEFLLGLPFAAYPQSRFVMYIKFLFGTVFNAFHDEGCFFTQQVSQPSLGGHDCLDARYTFPHLTTPTIMLAQRWDTYDLYIKYGQRRYVCSSVTGFLTEGTRNYTIEYGRVSHQQSHYFRSKISALFMPVCYKHTSFGITKQTPSGPVVSGPPCGSIDGQTPYQALVVFVEAALAGHSNLDEFSKIETPPEDGLTCGNGCGAKQCSWATNFNANFNGSCPAYTSTSFGAYGISLGRPHCSTNVSLPAEPPTNSSGDRFLANVSSFLCLACSMLALLLIS